MGRAELVDTIDVPPGLEATPSLFVLRPDSAEPGDAYVNVPIVVPYGPQTIIANSEFTGEERQLRVTDRYIGALFTGVATALTDQGVDPWITARRVSEMTQGAQTNFEVRHALDKLTALGVVKKRTGTYSSGYRPTVPIPTLQELLVSRTNIRKVPPPQPDLWQDKIHEYHRDLVASILRYIQSHQVFLPHHDMADLDIEVPFREEYVREILHKIATHGEEPLLGIVRQKTAFGYGIRNGIAAERILRGQTTEYTIHPVLLARTVRTTPETEVASESRVINPYSGTIQFEQVDGTEKSISPSMVARLTLLAARTDEKERRNIVRAVSLRDMYQGTGFSKEQIIRAMDLAKQIGIVHEDTRGGYRLMIPTKDFYDMLTGEADMTIPYPDNTVAADVGYPQYQLEILTVVNEYLSLYGQFVFRDHGRAAAQRLGLELETLRETLNKRLTQGDSPLLMRITDGIYVTTPLGESSIQSVVTAYNTYQSVEVIVPEPTQKTKRVEFAEPPPDILAEHIRLSLLQHTHNPAVREKLEDPALFLAMLQDLEPEQRTLLWNRLWRGLRSDQIARVMGTSYGAAKARQHRAIAHLERYLGKGSMQLDKFEKPREVKKRRNRRRPRSIREFRGQNRGNIEILRGELATRNVRELGTFAQDDPTRFTRFLESLNAHQQRYLYYRYVQGKSVQELGRVFQWENPYPADFQQIKRIKDALRVFLGGMETGTSDAGQEHVVFDASTHQP